MRISKIMILRGKAISAVVAASAVALLAAAPARASEVQFKTSKDALMQGVSAYSGGYYEMAIPALKFASEHNEMKADFFLARIYSDNTGSNTNHPAAYELYRRIVDAYADVDPEDDPAAPYVGKSLTALAGYMLRGLPEIGLKPNPEVAADYLNNASATFNDEDAQFELAKLQLKGEGVELDVPKAKHWLATLSRKGHAGAQAFLADLLWRGLYMEANHSQALALISVAVANAQPQDRLWIEDIHQNIYCGSGEGIRKQASGIVAGWGDRYSVTRKIEDSDRTGFGPLAAQPVRTCQNGELVGRIGSATDGVSADATAAAARPGFLRGEASGAGLRDVRTMTGQ